MRASIISITQRFDQAYEEWKRATDHMQSNADKTTHPTYCKIIDLGMAALPLIIERVESEPEPDDLFLALEVITHAHPTQKGTKDLIQKKSDWLAWYNSRQPLVKCTSCNFIHFKDQFTVVEEFQSANGPAEMEYFKCPNCEEASDHNLILYKIVRGR